MDRRRRPSAPQADCQRRKGRSAQPDIAYPRFRTFQHSFSAHPNPAEGSANRLSHPMAQFLGYHRTTPELGRRRSDLCRSPLYAGNLPDLSFQEWRPQGRFQPHRRPFFPPAARNRHETARREQPSRVGNAAFSLQDIQACYICTRLLCANPQPSHAKPQ